MNWLDEYIINNEEGYFKDEYGGHWVKWGDDGIRHAFGGDVETNIITRISRDEFIENMIADINRRDWDE